MVLLVLLLLGLIIFDIKYNNIESEERDFTQIKAYTSNSKPPFIEWTQIWGGIDIDYAVALALDSSENIYTVGESYFGYPDLVLTKFNTSGTQIWNRTWGGDFYDEGNDIFIDSADNIYVVGSTQYVSDDYDFLLIKYNTAGDQIWNQTWGGSGRDIAFAVALDPYNNIYLAGLTSSFGAGASDFCLVKFNSSGDYQWSRTWGGSGNEQARDMVLDSAGNIYLAGDSQRNFINKIKIVKYNNSGGFLWNQTIEVGIENIVLDIVIDSFNNIFLTGMIEEYRQLPDVLLLKLNSSGETLWYSTWGGSGRDIGAAIRIDDYGGILVGGTTDSYNAFKTDAALIKFNQFGEVKWNFSWGNYFNDYFRDLIFDSVNNIYVTGFCNVLGEESNSLLFKINNPPIIFMNTPSSYQQFGNSSFFYNISVFDANLDTMWYSLDNMATNFTISSTTGYVNQTAWDSCENGTVSVRFYANDTTSNLSFEDIVVLKDSKPPEIIINSPLPSQVVGNNSPNFNVSIIDGNLNSTWYDLNNTLTHTFNGLVGNINQSFWDTFDSGTIEIKFSATDTLGNSAFKKVEVVKDNIPPFFEILSPLSAQVFGNSSPHFRLNIIESNINKSWYVLNETLEDNFIGDNGIINQTLWDTLGDGDIKIDFYINDLAGNIESKEITVRKDISAPSIIIHSPKLLQLFGNNTPFFNVTTSDSNLNSTWYSLDGGITNHIYSGITGYIIQSAWDSCENGTVTIRFYANDTTGLTVYSEVMIAKDKISPIITINSPLPDQLFGINTPKFELSINETNLHTIWYTLNNGENYMISTNTFVVDSIGWNTISNGTILVEFFANDTLGNIGNNKVLIRKDGFFPTINVILPFPNKLFGVDAPDISLSVIDDHFESLWYSLDNGITNITCFLNATINQQVWDDFGNGTVSIDFFANDLAGNIRNKQLIVRKDITAPLISVNYPSPDEIFQDTPMFNISIFEPNLDRIWYSINNENEKFFIEGTVGFIDSLVWDNISEGQITLTFFANDTVGNSGNTVVIVIKEIPSSQRDPTIGGFPIYTHLFFLVISILGISVLLRRKNLLSFR